MVEAGTLVTVDAVGGGYGQEELEVTPVTGVADAEITKQRCARTPQGSLPARIIPDILECEPLHGPQCSNGRGALLLRKKTHDCGNSQRANLDTFSRSTENRNHLRPSQLKRCSRVPCRLEVFSGAPSCARPHTGDRPGDAIANMSNAPRIAVGTGMGRSGAVSKAS